MHPLRSENKQGSLPCGRGLSAAISAAPVPGFGRVPRRGSLPEMGVESLHSKSFKVRHLHQASGCKDGEVSSLRLATQRGHEFKHDALGRILRWFKHCSMRTRQSQWKPPHQVQSKARRFGWLCYGTFLHLQLIPL